MTGNKQITQGEDVDSTESPVTYSIKAKKQYAMIPGYAERRNVEISEMLGPYIETTDKYGELLTRICIILGEIEPQSIQDSVLRDLMSDVFDFLYESRAFVLRGQILLAYPLARRAYESLSLMQWCSFDQNAAEAWSAGEKYQNYEVRNALAKHPMGENKEELKELYNFFCGLTHPNRDMIAFRGLGEGNQFVFSSIGTPNLVEVANFCMKSLELWYWFCPVAVWAFKDIILQKDRSFFPDHNNVRGEAQELRKWLISQYNHVLDEWEKSEDTVQPKHN